MNIKSIKKILFNKRLIKFGLVGFSGVIVNTGLLYFFTKKFGLNYKISSIIAIETSIISNFLLNDLWTWRDRNKVHLYNRIVRYHISSSITSLIFNWGLLILLTDYFKLFYIISNLIGIGFGMVSNFILNNFWTFKSKKST